MDSGEIAQGLMMALGEALLRKGVLDSEDIAAASNRASNGSETGDTVGHLLGCMILQASAPSQVEWEAERRRKRMRIVPKGEE